MTAATFADGRHRPHPPPPRRRHRPRGQPRRAALQHRRPLHPGGQRLPPTARPTSLLRWARSTTCRPATPCRPSTCRGAARRWPSAMTCASRDVAALHRGGRPADHHPGRVAGPPRRAVAAAAAGARGRKSALRRRLQPRRRRAGRRGSVWRLFGSGRSLGAAAGRGRRRARPVPGQLDLGEVERCRRLFPWLQDRRPDLYGAG